MKVIGPLNGERINKKGNISKFDLYMLTDEFPSYHYLVILDILDNFDEPGNIFYVVSLITHSYMYNNLKITEKLFDKNTTTIDLTKSYITRDKFIIPASAIASNEIFGYFDLGNLEIEFEY